MRDIKLAENEKWEDLGCGKLKILQSKDLYRFTSDSVILANMVKAKPSDTIVDLGTGSGIIAILLYNKSNAKKIVGLEIQKEMFEMAQKSVVENNIEDRVSILNMDIRNAYKNLGNECANVVVCNPPYEKDNQEPNANQVVRNCNLEINGTLNDFCLSAKRLLKYGGKFYMIIKAKRMSESLVLLTQNGLEPKQMFLNFRSKQDEPDTVVIEAVKGGKVGMSVKAHFGEK